MPSHETAQATGWRVFSQPATRPARPALLKPARPALKMTPRGTRRSRFVEFLALERNVAAASAALFLLGLGEELWKKYLPKYLEALGAGTLAIGAFGTVRDFLDAIYQYPGGWLADRFGRRRAFLAFIAIASAGYLV